MPVNSTQDNTDKVKKLHTAYTEFLRQLSDFEKKEKELGNQIRKAVDQEKIHNILQKIVKIKN